MFTSDGAPVTVGLLVDNSGSMQPNRERISLSRVFDSDRRIRFRQDHCLMPMSSIGYSQRSANAFTRWIRPPG
ncbi:MAG: hypothetical protein DMF89_21405 [Acidobacteria bacterium]|nr:MAG: hypothetical protein DMF89_21405 [Acidobacteriota bacterium]